MPEPRVDDFYEDGVCLWRIAFVYDDGDVSLENCWTNETRRVRRRELADLRLVDRDSSPDLATASSDAGGPG